EGNRDPLPGRLDRIGLAGGTVRPGVAAPARGDRGAGGQAVRGQRVGRVRVTGPVVAAGHVLDVGRDADVGLVRPQVAAPGRVDGDRRGGQPGTRSGRGGERHGVAAVAGAI